MVRAKLASYAARALEDNSADASVRLDPPAEVAEVTRPVMRSRRVQPLQPETRRARRGDARRFAARGRATGSVTRDPARGRASELDMARRRRTTFAARLGMCNASVSDTRASRAPKRQPGVFHRPFAFRRSSGSGIGISYGEN